MEINSKILKNQDNNFGNCGKLSKSTLPTVSECVELPYPNANVMRAYTQIKPFDIVPKQELVDYLKSLNFQNDEGIELVIKRLAESDGSVHRDVFDYIKEIKNKSNKNILGLSAAAESCRENGVINRKMLSILSEVATEFNTNNSRHYLHELPFYFKNKDGLFNNDLLDIVESAVKENPSVLSTRPDYLVSPFITRSRKFDVDAIDYFNEQKALNREVKEIRNEIFAGRGQNELFSRVNASVYSELSPHLETWKISKIQEYAQKIKDPKELIEIAKTSKDDDLFMNILEAIDEISSSEANKTNLAFDKKSIDFFKKLNIDDSYRLKNYTKILKIINKPYSELTKDNFELINKCLDNVIMCDIPDILDAAVIKAGEKQGEFSFSNLDKYIDIYRSNMNDINEVKYVSNLLSLETDDKALSTIKKLYELEWHVEGRFGTFNKKLDKRSLHLIFDLSTKNGNNGPQRQFYPRIINNLNKLMTMHLPMTSKEAFENFMTVPEFDIIEKLERVRLDEIGINTGQLTHGKFTSATEEELLEFKTFMLNYMADKNKKNIAVHLNDNIKDVVEIKDIHSGLNSDTILYDITKKKPIASVNKLSGGLYTKIKENSYVHNSVVEQMFREEKIAEHSSCDFLQSQIYEQFDEEGKLKFTEKMEKSEIEGVYNVDRVYPDGRVEHKVKAQRLPNGNQLVKKNLTSADGTKTLYRYEEDVLGNRIMDYKIIDSDGKVLMDESSTFEVLGENHFISSRNNKKYEIKYEGDFVNVKDFSTGKTTTINLEEFCKGTQTELLPALKKIPGDEYIAMKEFGLKSIHIDNSVDNAGFTPKLQEIKVNPKYVDEGILMHELGHAKDEMAYLEINEQLVKQKDLTNIYEYERANVRKIHPNSLLEHISYFGADYHYLGSEKMREGIAEGHMLLDVLPRHRFNAVRANEFMENFPKFIARARKLLH